MKGIIKATLIEGKKGFVIFQLGNDLNLYCLAEKFKLYVVVSDIVQAFFFFAVVLLLILCSDIWYLNYSLPI